MAARTKARKAALDLLFEADQRSLNVAELLGQRLEQPAGDSPVREYTATLVRGVVEHWTAINDLITTWAQGWTLERMPAVDRAILRLGTFEVVYAADVPEVVAIDEWVALATDLSTDESPKFVNGVWPPARAQADLGLSCGPDRAQRRSADRAEDVDALQALEAAADTLLWGGEANLARWGRRGLMRKELVTEP